MSVPGLPALVRRPVDRAARRDPEKVRSHAKANPLQIPQLPDGLLRHVLYVEQAQGRLLIYVDAREKMSAQFLSWRHSVVQAGFACEIEAVTIAQLQLLRQQLAAPSSEEDYGQDMLQLAFKLFLNAGAAGVSDVTLMRDDHDMRVVVRLDGSLFVAAGDQGQYSMFPDEGLRFERAVYNGLATSKTDEAGTFDPRAFQDAQIRGTALLGSGLQNVRIKRGPADPIEAGGGFLAARLQARPGAKPATDRAVAIEALGLRPLAVPTGEFTITGLRPEQIDKLMLLVGKPDGVIIQTGPTGSGKTTTQFRMLEYGARAYPNRRQVTIENPPEYKMPWAIQLLAGNRSFVELLSETLRMDPDVLVLGETREAKEAWAALQAAMTGHLVFTTVHVKDPYRVFQRIEDMDPVRLSRRSICDHEVVVGVVGQCVMPLLCPHCRQSLSAGPVDAVPAHILDALRTWGDVSNVYIEGEGCEKCHHTKHVGRQGIAQIVITDEQLMDDLRSLPLAEVKRRHRLRGDAEPSLTASAVALVLAGKVSPIDAQTRVDLAPCDGEVLPPVGNL